MKWIALITSTVAYIVFIVTGWWTFDVIGLLFLMLSAYLIGIEKGRSEILDTIDYSDFVGSDGASDFTGVKEWMSFTLSD